MFLDSYRRSLTTTVNVTEQKAPTDESIRLYGEMLDKARRQVAKELSFPIEMSLKYMPVKVIGNVTTFNDELSNIYKVYIDVLGEKRVLELNCFQYETNEDVCLEIYKQVANITASKILTSIRSKIDLSGIR